MRTGHEPKRDRGGRYEVEQRCDCCAKPIRGEHYTDDEVCGASDGPGFYLCGRVRCCAKREGLPVEARRALYRRHDGSDQCKPETNPSQER